MWATTAVGHDTRVAFDSSVTQAREAIAGNAWATAGAAYAEADGAGELSASDLEAWGLADGRLL